MTFVTLKVFDTPVEAHLLKTKLESEYIDVFLFDEHTVSINPLESLALGGIKLKVREQDVGKASRILYEVENALPTDDKGNPITCPKCQSEDLYKNFKTIRGVKGITSIIIAFATLTYPVYQKLVYRCRNCQTEFE